MIHNGIEYAMMQIISEAYHIMKLGMKMSNQEIHQTFMQWNKGKLNSYLIEITADIFKAKEVETGEFLIDLILDKAKQKELESGPHKAQWILVLQYQLLTPLYL